MTNVRFEFPQKDLRPAMVMDNVQDAYISGLQVMADKEGESVLRLINCKEIFFAAPRLLNPAKLLLQLEGAGCEAITLQGGDTRKAEKQVAFTRGADKESNAGIKTNCFYFEVLAVGSRERLQAPNVYSTTNIARSFSSDRVCLGVVHLQTRYSLFLSNTMKRGYRGSYNSRSQIFRMDHRAVHHRALFRQRIVSIFFIGFLIGADADEHHFFPFHLFRKLFQVRYLRLAGTTPGGPNIHHHQLSSE